VEGVVAAAAELVAALGAGEVHAASLGQGVLEAAIGTRWGEEGNADISSFTENIGLRQCLPPYTPHVALLNTLF